MVNGLLPLTSSGFYLVDPDMKTKGVVLRGIEKETDRAYRIHYKDLDPAHPSRLQNAKTSLQCLSRSMTTTQLHDSIFYKEFLKPIHIEDAVDVFLRRDGLIIAVITLLRDNSLPRFDDRELDTLRAAQRFLEYAINSVYIPDRISQRNRISDKYGLTNRELDVLEWIMAGEENRVIAEKLSVQLATVKTHLHHIFTKLGVNSKIKVLSKVFSEFGF